MNKRFNRRRTFWLCRFAAPAFAAGLCVGVFAAPSAWAQANQKVQISSALVSDVDKAIGKDDSALFRKALKMFSDAKTAVYYVGESASEIKIAEANNAVIHMTGKTVLRGNYGGAFRTEQQVQTKQGDTDETKRTEFICDGKTLWTVKPDEKKYTEEPFAGRKRKFANDLMNASMDFIGCFGAEWQINAKDPLTQNSRNDIKKATVANGAYQGVPCRVLTLTVTGEKEAGTCRVYVNTQTKQMQAIVLQNESSGAVARLTETVRGLKTMTPAPDASLFVYTPPAGVVKVEKFDE